MANRLLTAGAQAMLEQLPPFMRKDKLVQASLAAQAQEYADLDAALLAVYADAIPLLTQNPTIWEAVLELVPGTGSTVTQRRASVLTKLAAVVIGGSGALWEDNMASIFGSSGWYYREWIPVSERPRNEVLNPSGEASAVGVAPANWTTSGTNTLLTDNAIPAKYRSKVVKATYNNNLLLAQANTGSITFTDGKIGSSAIWVWIPTNWDGGQVQIAVSSGMGGTILGQQDADMTKRDQWQRMWLHVQKVGTAATVKAVTVQLGAAPTVGRFIYLDGAQLRVEKSNTLLDDYGDGSFVEDGGYAWASTADASASVKLSSSAAYTVDVFIPLDPASPQAKIAEAIAQAITPANLVLNVSYTDGFILGASTLGDVL